MKVLVILLIVVALSKQQSQCDSSDDSSDRSSDSRDSHEHHHHHHHRGNHQHPTRPITKATTKKAAPPPPPRKPPAPPKRPPALPPKRPPPKRPPPKCPTGWQMFERISGKWCIQVFDGIFNRNEAQAKCQRLGATLSGMENAHEKHYMHTKAVQILKKQNLPYGAMWLGIMRKKDCRGEANRNKEACQKSRAFYWNDGSTFNTNMMTWSWWNPDNRGGDQNCVYMYISASGQPHPNGAHPGNLDDIPCDMSRTGANLLQYTRAYACGMKPK
ncbi:unnamed protein product [Caenorhabditis angaria]|uniref:C-type lectin domain-containing protein n=1 Tax=Caenorhabditis angaria TaxID=860376 RepID=A0A9P1IJ07_9PELO|nr:unnamed protein product [Caenorhabditis angaria]